MFQSFALPTLAALGIVAGLYHTINHACFKGLLFLGAGAVVHATGTRNMEELGGLIKRMPRTAFFFLVGACAISALPPLNGFASEWLVFQTLLGGSAIPQPEVAVIMPIAVAMLALTSGLAAACFVKAFGITFLAIPRSPRAEGAHEAPLSMQTGMATLAAACVALGLLPFLVVPVLGATLDGFKGLAPATVAFTLGLPLRIPGLVGQMSPSLLASGSSSWWDSSRWASESWAPTGDCAWGTRGAAGGSDRRLARSTRPPPLPSRSGGCSPSCTGPPRTCRSTFHPESKYFVQSIDYRSEIHPWFERALYEPLVSGLRAAAARVRGVQAGSVHLYLVYMTVALLVLLVVARWSR